MGRFADALRAEIQGYDETEWTGTLGGVEMRLLARPITSADMARISRAHPDFARSPSMEGMIDLIILKARDEHGEAAFDKGDKPLMMRVGTNKIGEIFAALFGSQLVEDDEEAFEDRVKN